MPTLSIFDNLKARPPGDSHAVKLRYRGKFRAVHKSQIQQGRYISASEVIRDGLRALVDREKLRALKLEALRSDIQQGINSGPGRPVQEVAAALQASYQQWEEQGAAADVI